MTLKNKFKEEYPFNTVNKIRNILFDLGIFTTEIWIDSNVEGCYSLRVEIEGTQIGQNGKGATKEFALASAYAELMERIQNDYWYIGDYDNSVWKYKEFYCTPDEKIMSTIQLANANNLWLDSLFKAVAKNDTNLNQIDLNDLSPMELFGQKINFLNLCDYQKILDNENCLITIPFYSLKTNKLSYIPISILKAFYATSGTCAGNTKEEAIVQGMSEIFERYANLKILKENIVPPNVPDWYLQKFEKVYNIIDYIRNQKEFNLIIKDCSIGMSFPVVASILINKLTQTYIVKFGAHPVFEIAVERSLTELLQGRNLLNASKVCTISENMNYSSSSVNIHNCLKNSSSKYTENFFSNNFDYEFKPFCDNSTQTNSDLLKYVINIISKKGYEILIRDTSYLGFCSYQIIIPGFSEIYNFGYQRLREKYSLEKARDTIKNITTSSYRDILSLINYLEYKLDWVLENSIEFTVKLPIKQNYNLINFDYRFLLAICYYRLGEYVKSYNILKPICDYTNSDRDYYCCIRDYIWAKSKGIKHNEIIDYLYNFYNKDIVIKAAFELENEDTVLSNIYKPYNCWDCKNCNISNKCSYSIVKNIKLKLKQANSNNIINQIESFNYISTLLKELED